MSRYDKNPNYITTVWLHQKSVFSLLANYFSDIQERSLGVNQDAYTITTQRIIGSQVE